MHEAVTGPRTGDKLKPIASTLTTWKRWREKNPETLVLSTRTGYSRDYTADPYEDYYKSPFAFFGFREKTDPRLPEKELVLGVEITRGDVVVKKAYPFNVLKKTSGPVKDVVLGTEVLVHFDSASQEAYITGSGGLMLPSMVSYWFVWSSFNPETTIYKEP